MRTCKKVSFATEGFALEYIQKLKRTSKRSRKPVNTYLCEKCLTWHLTSTESDENKQLIYLNRQIENLKSRVRHMLQENKALRSKLKPSRV